MYCWAPGNISATRYTLHEAAVDGRSCLRRQALASTPAGYQRVGTEYLPNLRVGRQDRQPVMCLTPDGLTERGVLRGRARSVKFEYRFLFSKA
jgi:hypothetical protein